MVSLLIRLLALIGLLWTGKQVAHHVSSAVQPGNRKTGNEAEDSRLEGDMVHDPVCRTYVPKSLAIQKTIAGRRVYFCSHECAAKFIEQQHEEAEQ